MRSLPIFLALFNYQSITRLVMKNWLNQHEEFNVLFDTADINELLQKLQEGKADILLFDVSAFEDDFFELIRYTKEHCPSTRTLVIAKNYSPEAILRLLDLGVYACLNENSDTSELLEAIRTIEKGQVHRNKIITDALYLRTGLNRHHEQVGENIYFNDKQKKLLQLLWEEKNTNEIAAEIFLSASAVEKMKQRMKENVGAKTSIGLMKFALENKIIF